MQQLKVMSQFQCYPTQVTKASKVKENVQNDLGLSIIQKVRNKSALAQPDDRFFTY